MQPFGSDRLRHAGEKLILLSAIPKGWTPRVPKTNTSAEYPGTAVLWLDQYFEVVEAAAGEGERVRYVLAPWREEHTIRTFESYDAESEARRLADHQLAHKQRRASAASAWSGMFLGHLPSAAQVRMQNELGLVPSRITIASCIPPMVLFGIFVMLEVEATLTGGRSPIPSWLFLLGGFMFVESLIRMTVALSSSRGIGSVIGTIGYFLFRRELPAPGRGTNASFTLPPPDDVVRSDALMMKAPFLTLLSRAEQERLAERHGFDYRKHAYGLTWTMLVFGVLGIVSSYGKAAGGSLTALLSLLVALAVAAEQILRLVQLPRGPAPSLFAVVVRPFVRDVLADSAGSSGSSAVPRRSSGTTDRDLS
ncbi:MAG TPA: hypothetical protein VGF28_21415 [Thermoanaerobaculia bacterium]|jgi:hypothetical protein